MNEKTEYWLNLCNDDLETAKVLLEKKRLLHMGFFCHMIVEKSLKAAIVSQTDKIPPKTHDLPRLANLGGIWDKLSIEQKDLFKTLMPL